VHYDLTIH